MQDIENIKYLLFEGAKQLGFPLSQVEVSQFLNYLEMLKRWNSKINLTAVRDDRGIIILHFLDSIAGLAALSTQKLGTQDILVKTSYRVMDVGSGAGFPGLPLKICRPQILLTLVEANKKKAAFLHSISGHLGLEKVDILDLRLEALVKERRYHGNYDFVISRAVKSSRFLNQASIFLRPGGQVVLWVSRKDKSLAIELKHLRGWSDPEAICYRLPFEDIERSLILLTKLEDPFKV
jgi:16S rRNA (guanine527-N7)-methyltransferase